MTNKNDKTEENPGICWDEKKKATQVKQTTRRNKSKGTGERRTTRKKSRQEKTAQTKLGIPKQRK